MATLSLTLLYVAIVVVVVVVVGRWMFFLVLGLFAGGDTVSLILTSMMLLLC